MKSAGIQSLTVVIQVFFKEFKMHLSDQLLKQIHSSLEMKVHGFCQVFPRFILLFPSCYNERF